MKMILMLALLMLAGCPGLMVHSHRNAPGRVDLDHAPARESGDPVAYDAPIDPGEYRAMILPGAYLGGGQGRRFGAMEVGVQLRFTLAEAFDESSKRDEFAMVESAWGGTIGWGIVQDYDGGHMLPTTIGGPIYAEINHSLSICGIGAGVAVYPAQTEVGPQLSAWCWPYLFRMRYEQTSGWEVYGGFQVELPTVWTWSR